MNLISLIMTLAIMAGQLVKIPTNSGGGATILDITIIILCLFGFFQIKLGFIKPPIFITSALIFCLIALLSLILTPLHLQASQYLSSFLYLIRFLSVILLGWLLLSKALPFLKKNLDQILLLSGIGLAILGLCQFIFFPDLRFLDALGWDPHYFRTASTFLDPNFSGAFFVLTLLLLFQKLTDGQKWVIFYVVVYASLLTTFSRSSYLMFLISFLTLAFLKKSIKILSLTIILFLVLLFSFRTYIFSVNQVTPLDRNQTASYRLSTWKQGWDIFLKNPSLGVGFNTYSFALKQYHLGSERFLQGRGATTNDSSLLYVLSTTGILGLISYLLFLLSILKLGWTKNHVLAAGILGLLAHSFFVNSLFYPFILIWIIFSAVYSYEKSFE